VTATACQVDPALFDVDRRAAPGDVHEAIAACLTCPMLAACKADLAAADAAGRELHGIIAGEHRPWPKTGPGRPATSPCGTVAAYYRHLKHGEPTDALCRSAARNAVAKARRRRDRQAGAA
jgi:hypothetical protein